MTICNHKHSRLLVNDHHCSSYRVISKGLGDSQFCVRVDKKDEPAAPFAAERHGHDQSQRDDVQRRLKLASILCLLFLVCEIAGGLISGSLAVLSDAAHLFSDLMGFVFAIAAGKVASMPGSRNYTFGYRRWEVIAALFSMCSLAIFSILLEAEGIRRLMSMILSGDQLIEEIDGKVMSAMAFIGVIINISLAFILGVENHVHMPGDDHHHDHSNYNHEYSPANSDERDADGGVIEIVNVGGQHPFLESMNFPIGESHNHDHSHSNGENTDEEVANPRQHARVKGNAELSEFLQSMTFASGECHNHTHLHSNGEGIDEEVDNSSLGAKCDPVSRRGVSIPKQNINMHAAYLHVLGDLVQSIALFVAGIVVMYKPEWKAADPILSIIFCPLIFYSTLGVIRTSMQILLEGSPTSVNVDELWSDIGAVEGITQVTNLHVWSISHGSVAMTVHARAIHPQTALHDVHVLCTRSYGIDHCTIQIEDHSSDRFLTTANTTHFYVPEAGSG